MRSFFTSLAAVVMLSFSLSRAQERTDGVVLFQTFFQDAPIAKNISGEGFLQYSDFENFSSIDLAVQSAFPVSRRVQIGGALGFRSLSFNGGDESGITDLAASMRYLAMQGPTAISVGGLITLPIGSEDIGESNFDFTGFGSLRHHFPSGLVLTSTLGLEFIEKSSFVYDPVLQQIVEEKDHDAQLLLAGGLIVPAGRALYFVGELDIRTEGDYVLLSGGLDYALKNGGRLRGALGLGLDDGAPNFALRGGYALGF